jgi:hypothetical protein
VEEIVAADSNDFELEYKQRLPILCTSHQNDAYPKGDGLGEMKAQGTPT